MTQEKDDGFDSEELVAFARLDIERGDLERGLAKLKRVVDGSNVPPVAYAMTAGLYAQLRLFDRAEKLFQKYLSLEPNDLQARLSLGMTQLDSGRAAEALAVWEELLSQKPGHPPALFYKAVALAEVGRRADAVSSLDGLLASVPADNLFFEQAKELRGRLESGQPKSGSGRGPVGTYRTEH